MHPLSCAARVLADRLRSLEKDLPKDPHDREGWRDYMETAALLVQVTEANKAPIPAVVVRGGGLDPQSSTGRRSSAPASARAR